MTAVWQDHAECAGMPGRWWFPEEHDTATRAKKICAECPVRGACYTTAVTNNEQYGIWGGVNFSKGATRRRGRAANDTRGIMGAPQTSDPRTASTAGGLIRTFTGGPDMPNATTCAPASQEIPKAGA